MNKKTTGSNSFNQKNSILSLDEPSLNIPPLTITEEELSIDDFELDESSLSMFVPPKVLAFNNTKKPDLPPLPKQPSIPPPSMPRSKSIPPPPPNSGSKKPTLRVKNALLGAILVDNNLITETEKDYCLKLQIQSGNFYKLGELAVKNGFISQEDLEKALVAQNNFIKSIKKEQSKMIRLPEDVARVEPIAIEEPVDQKCLKWVDSAFKYGASDLHVMSGHPLILRHFGRLIKSKQQPLSAQAVKEALFAILTSQERAQLEENGSIRKCIDIKNKGRARVIIVSHINGYNGSFRLVPHTIPSLVSLNLPSAMAKFTTFSQGLVLLTGPIGCGKTTTMAALIDIVNKERRNHIITIEKPIEFIHKNQKSIVTQRQVGEHTSGYTCALRAALREDPDVIAVGDINNLETARLTISAAETGHLVFATLHTDNAVRTINRLLDIFPPGEQAQIRAMLSESLRGVICQRLIAKDSDPGLIPVVEMLFTTPAMRNLIRESKVYQIPNAVKMSKDIGNQMFDDHAAFLLKEGIISQNLYDLFCLEQV